MSSEKSSKARPRDAARSAVKERRTEARKAQHVAVNLARKEANIAAIGAAGGTYNPHAKREKPYTVTVWTGTRYETTQRVRMVSMGPSEQLIATRRRLA